MPAANTAYYNLGDAPTESEWRAAQRASRLLDSYIHREDGGVLLRYVTDYPLARTGRLDADWGAMCDTRIESIDALKIGTEAVDADNYEVIGEQVIRLEVEPVDRVSLTGWIGWGAMHRVGLLSTSITAGTDTGISDLAIAGFTSRVGQTFSFSGSGDLVTIGYVGGSQRLLWTQGEDDGTVHSGHVDLLVPPEDLAYVAQSMGERAAGQLQRARDAIEEDGAMLTVFAREAGLTYNLGVFMRKYTRFRTIDVDFWNRRRRDPLAWRGT